MPVIKTKECLICGVAGEVEVTEEELVAYQNRTGYIQDVVPRLSDAEREMLISGTHSDCFDRIFPPDEED